MAEVTSAPEHDAARTNTEGSTGEEGLFWTPPIAIASAVRSLRALILGKAEDDAKTVAWNSFERQISLIFRRLAMDEEAKSWETVAFKSHLERCESDLRDAGTAIDGTEPRARSKTCYVILEATGSRPTEASVVATESAADTSPVAKRTCTHKMKETTCNLAEKLRHIVRRWNRGGEVEHVDYGAVQATCTLDIVTSVARSLKITICFSANNEPTSFVVKPCSYSDLQSQWTLDTTEGLYQSE